MDLSSQLPSSSCSHFMPFFSNTFQSRDSVNKYSLASLQITSLLLKERGGASEPSLPRAVCPDADVQEGHKFRETTHQSDCKCSCCGEACLVISKPCCLSGCSACCLCSPSQPHRTCCSGAKWRLHNNTR